MEIDKKDIKEFAEFPETVPTATHNLITDKGRFTVSALYNAVAEYVRTLFEDSVESSAESASEASASATSASEAKTAALAAQSAAGASATAAATSASNANAAAELAETCMQSAESAKSSAQSSASAASASEESANGYAASATRSASAAEASATGAAASAASAQAAKSEAESAKTAARQSAASAAATDAGQLALCKSDGGMLYFTGGAATATPDLSGDTLSILFKTDFDFSVEQTADVLYLFLAGTMSTGKYLAAKFGGDNRLRVNAGASAIGSFTRADIAALATGEVNVLAFVFKKPSDGNAQLSFFVNGVAVQNRATTTAAFPSISNNLSINRWSSAANTSAGTVGYSDFRIFNFDVSAEDAPYKLADYQKGKRLPPSLAGVQLALENYTFDGEIRDTSGNEQHATKVKDANGNVVGTVAGDMDNSINQMYSAFKAKYTQENAS